MSADQKKGARRGGVGAMIFEQVEKLVDAEGLTRTQAFERISQESGRRAGTVAANYYRIARQRGAPLQPRRRRGRSGSSGAAGSATAALKRAQEALTDLSALVRQQEKELEQLREQSAQFAKFKKWMEKNG